MAQDAAATFSRTLAAWQFPAGNDVSLQGRSLTLGVAGVSQGTLDGITAGVFTSVGTARFNPPSFLAVPNLSLELLIQPTTITATGFIFRAGSPSVALDVGFGLRLFLTGGNIVWSMLRSGTLNGQATVQSSDAATPVAFGQTYHVVAVAQDGALNEIYVNGVRLTLTHINNLLGGGAAPAGVLTGPITIPDTYELAIGDPSITPAGFAGTLGRMIVYPYPVTGIQAAASNLVQLGQAQAIGLAAESPISAVNHGPVAVPHSAGPVTADGASFVDIDTPTRSFDADAEQLTALPTTGSGQGVSQILNNRLRYTPTGGSGGIHSVPFLVRDPALLQSAAIVRVTVVDPLGDEEFPPLAGVVRPVNSAGDFAGAYADANPGDHVVIANGVTLGGTITLNRSGTAALPIVVRATAPFAFNQAPTFTTLTVGGNNNYIWGLRGVDGNLTGNNNIFRRIQYNNNNSGQIIDSEDGLDNIFRRCTFSNSPAGFRVHLRPRRWRFEFCHWFNITGQINATSAIEIMRGGQAYFTQAAFVVSDCLFENCNRGGEENETIAMKSSNNIIRRTQFDLCRSLSFRFGQNNQALGVRLTNSNEIGIRGEHHIIQDCIGTHELSSGSVQVANGAWDPNNDQTNQGFPNAVGCDIIRGTGTIIVGELDAGGNQRAFDAINNRVLGRGPTVPFTNRQGGDNNPEIIPTTNIPVITAPSFLLGAGVNSTQVGVNSS